MPGDHAASVADRVDGCLEERLALVVRERRRLAGRTRDHDPVGAVVEKEAGELLERLDVDRAVGPERGHDRSQHLAQHGAHSTRPRLG